MWSGAVNAIPTDGFVLCKQNGTPNLIDKFVVGAANVYSVGDTGSATTDTVIFLYLVVQVVIPLKLL